jgi:nitrogen regulatory protein PII
MTTLVPVQRVTIIADSVLTDTLLENLLRLGSNGYTYTECHGKGKHEDLPDPYTGISRVRIEVFVQPKIAEAVMEYLYSEELRHYALVACVETVQVSSHEKF